MIGSIISGVAGLANVGVSAFNQFQNSMLTSQNLAQQWKIAQQNFGLAQDAQNWQKMTDQRNFDYMKATQEQEWQRADTMHQREVEDLQKAGLSPIAAGNGNVTGNVVSQGSTPNPVVPQFDGTGLANAYSDMVNANNQGAALFSDALKSIYKETNENLRSQARNELESDINAQNINAKLNEIREQIASNEEIEDNKLKQDLLKHVDNVQTATNLLNEQIRHNKKMELLEGQRAIMENVESITGYQNYKPYYNVNEYKAAIDNWNNLYQEFQKNNLHLLASVSVSKSSGDTIAANGSVSINLPSIGKGKESTGSKGITTSGGGMSSVESGSSNSWDYSKEYYAREKEFMIRNPFPILRQ